MIYLTEEQAQQIEEALESVHGLSGINMSNPLSTIRAAIAQEQEPEMCYERINALREGEQNKAEDEYFNARPENDTPTLRKLFCHGFERGFHKGLKYAAPVEPVKQEPVAWRVRGYNQFKTGNPAPWRYVDGTDKPTVNTPDCCDFEPLYAAPVRTKDLTEKWIDPNDKSQKQYLPHIGEKILFCCDGEVYYGHHTGGSFQKGYGVTKSLFPTWDCMWMHLPAAAIRARNVDSVDTSPERVEKTPESIHDESTNLCQKSTKLVEKDCGGAHHHRYAGSFGGLV